jgi:uncharacterized protein YjbJ (UPF0337 family)
MNRDQIKGTLKVAAGKVQQKVGQVSGNKEQQVKGVTRQAEGRVQKTVGNAKDEIKKS